MHICLLLATACWNEHDADVQQSSDAESLHYLIVAIYHRAPGRATALTVDTKPFWEVKTLEQMTPSEWESLCDGCGRCCLLKLEDEDTAEVYLTRLTCRLLDQGTCKCKDYPNRHSKVHDCLSIDVEKVRSIEWLPATCGYRRIDEGRGLAWWHPLISGSPETVHEAGISVRALSTRSETRIKPASLHKYIIADFIDG
jgi:uncharacterized protein